MAPGEDAPKLRYSFRATMRSAFGLDRAERLEFYDDAILIYRRHFNFRRDSDYSLLRRVKYSDIQRCEYFGPKVESSKTTLVGFAWGQMPGEIELSVPSPDAGPARQGGEPLWKLEKLRFSGEDLSEQEFKEVYSWLRTKLELKQGNP